MNINILKTFKTEKIVVFIKKNKYILLIGLLGVLLLLLPLGSSAAKIDTNTVEPEVIGFNVEGYERKLESILAQVEGVGKVKVMLYLKSGMETIYATNSRYQTYESKPGNGSESRFDEDSQIAVVSKNGGQEPVAVMLVYPIFGGAVIVCEGAESPVVAYNILRAVASITGLSTDKITVLPRT